jgi:hypothetical protein
MRPPRVLLAKPGMAHLDCVMRDATPGLDGRCVMSEGGMQ